jgi:hypothetical protein
MMLLDAFADIASKFPWEERRPGVFGEDLLVRRESGGVVAAIVPWNVPLYLVVGKLAPALLAGCSIVVKPAPETPLDSLLFAELIEEAGLPPGLVSVLPGDGAVGEALVNHPGVDRVSFTGSTAVGRRIAAACGANLKKVSLELGGKSAAIVLDDADPAAVAQGVKVAGLMNNGQACVAQTRILVPAAREGEFLDALAAMVEGLVGDLWKSACGSAYCSVGPRGHRKDGLAELDECGLSWRGPTRDFLHSIHPRNGSRREIAGCRNHLLHRTSAKSRLGFLRAGRDSFSVGTPGRHDHHRHRDRSHACRHQVEKASGGENSPRLVVEDTLNLKLKSRYHC